MCVRHAGCTASFSGSVSVSVSKRFEPDSDSDTDLNNGKACRHCPDDHQPICRTSAGTTSFSTLTALTLNSGILARGSKASELVSTLVGFSPKWMGKNSVPGCGELLMRAGASLYFVGSIIVPMPPPWFVGSPTLAAGFPSISTLGSPPFIT